MATDNGAGTLESEKEDNTHTHEHSRLKMERQKSTNNPYGKRRQGMIFAKKNNLREKTEETLRKVKMEQAVKKGLTIILNKNLREEYRK